MDTIYENESTPKKDGYRMPGEFEPQECIWMLWPHRPDNWRDGAKPAQKAYADVARGIAQFEPVIVGVNPEDYAAAHYVLAGEENILVVEMTSDDSWIRDCGPTFVVNDDVEAARIAGADGVHVGQDDAACVEAREKLGPDAIVGVSVQTVEQALVAQADCADYLGVGAVFGTPTKPDAADVGTDGLAAICAAVDIPVVAIGGLNERTIPELAGTGADGAAVVSAIFAAEDIEEETRRLRAAVQAALGA